MPNPWELDWGKSADTAGTMPWERDWAGTPQPSAKPDDTGDTVKGFKRAFAQVPEFAYGAGALAAMSAEKLFGDGGLSTAAKDYFAEKYVAKQAENQKYAPSVEFTDAWENLKAGDVGSMADWLQDTAGYVVGQGLQTLATGGVGALVGKAALAGATEKMLGSYVAKQAAKIAEESVVQKGLTAAASEAAIKAALPEATKLAAQRTAQAIGAGLVLSAQNVGMEAGDIYGGLMEEAAKTGKEITGDDLLRAWGMAAAAAGTETATDLLGLGAVTGRLKIGGKSMQEMTGAGGRAARGATAAAIGVPIEAGQEYAQTYLEQVGAGKPTDTPEAQRERINAAAVGAVGGGVMGGGIGLISGARAPTPSGEPTPTTPEATANEIMAQTTLEGAIAKTAEITGAGGGVDRAVDEAALSTAQPAIDNFTQPIVNPNPEQRDGRPVAESIAPGNRAVAPGPGDARVAPGQVSVMPESALAITGETGGEKQAITGVDLRAQAAQLLIDQRGFHPDDAAKYAAKLGGRKELSGFIADNLAAPLGEQPETRQPAPGEALPGPATQAIPQPVAPQEASKSQPPAIRQSEGNETAIIRSMGLPGKLRPNTVYVMGADWSGGNRKEVIETREHLGDPLATFNDFTSNSPEIAPQATIATDKLGKPWKVISPNGKIVDFDSPEGHYALGDVDAFRKASAAKIERARAEGNPDEANSAADERIRELTKRIAETKTGIARNLREFNADKAKQKAGVSIKDRDSRFPSWREYFTNAQRILDAQHANLADQERELSGWQSQKVRTVSDSAPPTLETKIPPDLPQKAGAIPPAAQQSGPNRSAATTAAREPWEMTRGEFAAAVRVQRTGHDTRVHLPGGETNLVAGTTARNKALDDTRRFVVQRAIADGKAVPAAVLADYPDLQQNVGTSAQLSTVQKSPELSSPVEQKQEAANQESAPTERPAGKILGADVGKISDVNLGRFAKSKTARIADLAKAELAWRQAQVKAAPAADELAAYDTRKEAKRMSRLGDTKQAVIQHPTKKGKWAVVEVPKRERSQKQKVNDARLKARRNNIDTSRDSLFAAIGKLGGMSRAAVASEWGIDPKDTPRSGVIGKPVLRATGGMSVDGMAESLGQYGYLPLDENGKVDLADFENLFGQELRDDKVYAEEGVEAQAERRKADEDAQFLAAEAEAAGVEPAGENIADMDLMVLAGELDPDGLERLTIQFEGRPDAEFMAAVQELVDEYHRRNEAQDRGSQKTAAADEAGPAAQAAAEVAPALDLAGQSEEEIAADERTKREAKEKEEAAAREAEAQKKLETERKAIAQRSAAVAGDFSLTATEPVDKKTQQKADTKAAEEQLAGQGDIFSKPAAEMTPAEHLRAAADKLDAAAQPNPEARPASPVAEKYPRVTKWPGQPQVENDAQNRVVDAMNGEITVDQLIDELRATGLPVGTLAAFTERLGDKMSAAQQRKLLAPRQEGGTPGAISDFGEKIGGARKDYAETYRDRMKEAASMDIAAEPLSKSWPEPDYQKLLDEKADPWSVAFAHAARDEVPTKPQQSWKLSQWVKNVQLLRDTTNKIMAGELSAKRARELLADSTALKPVSDRAELYTIVGHDKSLKGVRISSGTYGIFNREKFDPPKVIWSVERKTKTTAMSRWPEMLAHGATREEAIANFKKEWSATPAEQEAKAVEFDIYSRRGTGQFFIGKKIGKNVVTLKDGFTTAKEARAWKAANQAELVKTLEKIKEVPNERRESNSPRVGADHRNGADVTPAQFSETFGFRGVEFGNYVEGSRRQADLNEAYDALMDLAGVLGVPTKALSLNGELALAFGARGMGGRSAGGKAAAAHYEPGKVVINLTKEHGAGSLAHEWFHAVDNYFSRARGDKAGFVTGAPGARGEGMRPEMLAAFNRVMAAVRSSGVKARSVKLDSARYNPYWGLSHEMAARSFESYVIAKLHDQGASNDYLANIVSQQYWDAAAALGMEKEGTYPYPADADMPAIRAAFDDFFKTVETRETDKGVEMYSQTDEPGPGLPAADIRAHLSAITAKLSVAVPVYDSVEAAREAGFSIASDAQGFAKGNQLGLISANINSMLAAETTLFHELWHVGIRKLTKSADVATALRQYDAALNRVAMANPEVRRRAKVWRDKYGADKREQFEAVGVTGPELELRVRMQSFDEAVAEIAGNRRGKPIARLNELIAALQRLVRALGFDELANWMESHSDAEVLSLIRSATQAITAPSGQQRLTGVQFPSKILSDSTNGIIPDGEPSYSQDNSVAGRQNLADRIDAILHGAKSPIPIYLGETPAVLHRLGTPKLPMGMGEDIADKALFDHGVSSREMKALADAIADPVAIVDSEAKNAPAGSLVVITDLVKSDGRPIIVAVHPDQLLDRTTANAVASVYPKDNAKQTVARWLATKLRYVNNEKRPEWQRFAGVQFPRKIPALGAGKIVLSEKEFVKADFVAVWGKDPFTKPAGKPEIQIRPGDVFQTSTGEALTVLRQLPGGRLEVRIQGKRLRVGEFTNKQLKESGWDMIGRADLVDGAYVTPDALIRMAADEDPDTMQSRLDQTQTAEFKRWFKDSRVVDAEGKPLVVYHGTNQDVADFRPIDRDGFYFTENYGYAGMFAEGDSANVLPAYLAIKNPADLRGDIPPRLIAQLKSAGYERLTDLQQFSPGERWELFESDNRSRLMAALQKAGYDGARIIEPQASNANVSLDDVVDTWVAFRPEQIKSAIGNRGSFSQTDPDIMHARAGPTDETQKDLADSPAGKAAGTWEKLAKTKNRIHEAIDKLAPLGTLPEQEAYLVKRYRALGRLAEVGTEARDLYAAFRDAGEHAPDVYAYLTHKDAQSTIIRDEAIRDRAVKAKETLTAVGQKLVDQGLLAKEVFEAHKGEYLPRIYLKHLLDDDAISALSSGKKPSDMGYLKARKDIPEDVRRLILGEITDPAYLVSKAYGTQMRDIALLDWLAEIATERAWVMPESIVEWEGKQVTPFWLKQTAKQVRTQSVRYTEADRTAARAIADRMDEAADTALEGYGGVPEGWKQIPDTPRYGRLRGLIVRSEIHDDIVGSARINPTDASVAEKVLGNGGLATKFTQLWKWSKVAANPPAQIRNFVSNGILLHLSGVSFHMVIPRVIQAIKEIRTNGEHWQIAKKFGVTESTFSAQELFRIEREFLDLQARGASPLSIATAKNLASKVMSFTSDIYQLSESIFKTAKIIDEMTKGKTEEQAMIQAQKWLFDYSLVTPSMRYLRNAPVGAPFITFYFKALPRLLEVATTHPLRLAPYLAIPYVLTALVASMADVDDDDVDRLKKALPEWLQERGNAHFLPMKDDKGRWMAMDIGYFLPWSMWQELGTEFAKGEFGKAMQSSGLLGGPLPDLIAAVKNNKDPFSKKEIVNEFDPPAKQIASVMGYLYSMSMPTWLTNYGFAGHMYNALNETVDKRGQVKSTAGQATLRLFGVNLYPINPEQSRADNLRRMKFEIQEQKRRSTIQLRDRNLSPEKRSEVAKEYGELIQKRMKDMAKYAQESRVHPNLSSGARP